MSRVLVTGGAGLIGAAVVRLLLGDPSYEVRVADQRPTPQWMRESCEVHHGDLRSHADARAAMKGCTHVIHLAALGGGIARIQRQPHTLIEANTALHSAVLRAAIDLEAERFLYVSAAAVFERAQQFPTPEEHVLECPPPLSAYGYSMLAGEISCRAAHEEHGFPYTICRPFNAYGPGELPGQEPGIGHAVPDLIAKTLSGRRPLQVFGSGEQTRTLTHVDDVAAGLLAALGATAALHEDFNLASTRELAVAEIARAVWCACGEDPEQLELEQVPALALDVQRRWPSVQKARELLGWEAKVVLEDGIAQTVQWLRPLLAFAPAQTGRSPASASAPAAPRSTRAARGVVASASPVAAGKGPQVRRRRARDDAGPL